MKDIAQEIRDALERGGDLVLATIFVQEGSAPRTAGTKMAVRRDGSTVGTIGGGLLEATVLQEASRVRGTGQALLHAFDLTKSNVADMDMICGGRVQVLVEGVEATSENSRVFAALAQRLARGRGAVLVTSLGVEGEGPWPAARCLVADGAVEGPLPLDAAAIGAVEAGATGARAPVLLTDGGRRLFVEPFAPASRAYFFGAGHVTGETEALARRVGFRTVVLDDRTEFASRGRYPEAEEVRCVPNFDDALRGLNLDRDAYVVIVTRGHSFDRLVLEQVLRTDAGYVGMIGSRHKWRAIYDVLRAQGVAPEDLGRVHCPVGVEIDAETPAEIAVSIVAELIRERAAKGG